MTQRGRLLLISTVTAALFLLTLWRLSGPGPAKPDAPAHRFSAARALALTGNVMKNAPHPIGSASHDRVRDRVSAALRSMAYAVDVQHTFASSRSDDRATWLTGAGASFASRRCWTARRGRPPW